MLDRVSPRIARWPRNWSRLTVRAWTYVWVSRVIRLKVLADRPTSSLPRTGTRAERSPSATRSAAWASSARGRVVERASHQAATTAPRPAMRTVATSTA